MKKLLCTIAALLALLLALSSCSGNGGGTDTSEGTQTGAETSEGAITPEDSEADAAAKQEAKLEALRILTPTKDEDGFLLSDDRVYCSQEDNTDSLFMVTDFPRDRLNPNEDPFFRDMGKYYLYHLTEGGKPELLCKKEGCKHEDITCTAVASQVLFELKDERTGDSYVYYCMDLPLNCVHINGQIVDLTAELGQHAYKDIGYSDKTIHVLFEYNVTTGARRTVTLDYANTSFRNRYYNGKLYVNYEINESSVEGDEYGMLMSVDTRTGEIRHFGGEPGNGAYDVTFAGIYEGKLYAVRSSDWTLVRSEPDFSGVEEVGKLPELPRFFGYGIYDGYLYICCGDIENDLREGTVLYRYSLSDGGELEKLVEKIDLFGDYSGMGYGGNRYVYYNKWDEKDTVYRTIYRYNIKTGEEEVFYENGPGLVSVNYVDDDRVIYGARLLHDSLGKPIVPSFPIEGFPMDRLDELTNIFYIEYTPSTGTHRLTYIQPFDPSSAE